MANHSLQRGHPARFQPTTYRGTQFDPLNPQARRIGQTRDDFGDVRHTVAQPLSTDHDWTGFNKSFPKPASLRAAPSTPATPAATQFNELGDRVTPTRAATPTANFPRPGTFQPTLPQLNSIVAPGETDPAKIGNAYRAATGNAGSRGTVSDTGATGFDQRGNRTSQTSGSGGFPSLEYDPTHDMSKPIISADGTVTTPGLGAGIKGGPALPPGANRGIVIDPKYQTPGASPLATITAGNVTGNAAAGTPWQAPGWHKDVMDAYPAIGQRGSPENAAFVAAMKSNPGGDPMALAKQVSATSAPDFDSLTANQDTTAFPQMQSTPADPRPGPGAAPQGVPPLAPDTRNADASAAARAGQPPLSRSQSAMLGRPTYVPPPAPAPAPRMDYSADASAALAGRPSGRVHGIAPVAPQISAPVASVPAPRPTFPGPIQNPLSALNPSPDNNSDTSIPSTAAQTMQEGVRASAIGSNIPWMEGKSALESAGMPPVGSALSSATASDDHAAIWKKKPEEDEELAANP